MTKHLIDLMTKVMVLPLSEEILLIHDYIDELLDCKIEARYKTYEVFQMAIQKELRQKYRVTQLDRVKLLVEQYFPIYGFDQVNSVNEFYFMHISKLASCFIAHRNGKICLKYWKNEQDEKLFGCFDKFKKIEVWNSLSRQFCMDLLVVSYLINNGMTDERYLQGYYWLITIGDLQLDQILQKGVAETHIHINAGIHFHNEWEQFLDIERINIEDSRVLKEIGAQDYISAVKIASILRRYICNYLVDTKYGNLMNFERYLFQTGQKITALIQCFTKWQFPKEELDYKSFYIEVKHGTDTIKELFRLEALDTTDENIFLMKSLKYLRNHEDNLLSNVFWKYIALKNVIYEKITQNNYIQGLDYFHEYYGRASHRLVNRESYLKSAIKNQIYNNYLTKLEIRLTPSFRTRQVEIRKEVVQTLKDFFYVYRNLLDESSYVPQMGIVFHFIKSKDQTFFEKCWCIEPDDPYKMHYFYGNIQKKYLQTMQVIKELRAQVPYLSKYIVGIDAAGNENNAEPWVFAPVYQMARDSKDATLVEENRYYNVPQEHNYNLGFTYHVGEDFRHVISGLRHIDEVIEHFGYHVGDRIGHGIALGIDINAWCEENDGIVIMPRMEYLENLLWIWGLGYKKLIDASSINTINIEKEILTQAKEIYQSLNGITVFNLWEAYQNKFKIFTPSRAYLESICQDEEKSKEINKLLNQFNIKIDNEDKVLCYKVSPIQNILWTPEKITHAYHCKCYLSKMYEVIQVNVNKCEIPLYENIQQLMIGKLDNMGIVVETNPTSNLAIGSINCIVSHHASKLNNIGLEQSRNNGLVITVNSDDPIVFNTTISNELAYIFYALQEKGYTRESILVWIDKIRQWGVETSFIQTRTFNKQECIMEIDTILEALKK